MQEIREGHRGWRDGQVAECICAAPAEVCEALTSLSQRRGGLTVIRHLAQYVEFKQTRSLPLQPMKPWRGRVVVPRILGTIWR